MPHPYLCYFMVYQTGTTTNIEMLIQYFHRYPLWILLITQLLLFGCSISSPDTFYRHARDMGLQRELVNTTALPLIVYSTPGPHNSDQLHVYLGGDGLPWRNLITISNDPSPRSPQVLRFMQKDPQPAIFLGRPCYQGLAQTPPCDYIHWTAGRFSKAIAGSMSNALQQIIKRRSISRVTLIGYSGGGALAILLAHHIKQTTTVVTIAGTLDTDAWARHHNYSPLNESINPATLPPLPEHIKQIHLQGKRDKNIPPHITNAFILRQHKPEVILYPQANHDCCWLKHWPAIVRRLRH